MGLVALRLRPDDLAGKPKNPWKVDKYHLIEPALRPRLQEKLKVWKEDPDLKVRHVKDFSYNAHKKFPDGYFDFVYVDAGHTYAEVKQDLGKDLEIDVEPEVKDRIAEGRETLARHANCKPVVYVRISPWVFRSSAMTSNRGPSLQRAMPSQRRP